MSSLIFSVLSLCSVRNRPKSLSYADNLSRECKLNASSRVFKTVQRMVIGLIGTPLKVVFKLCFKRNKSHVSISVGKPASQTKFDYYYSNTKWMEFKLHLPMYRRAPHSIILAKMSMRKFPCKIFLNSAQMRSPLIFCRPAIFALIASMVFSSKLFGPSAMRP